MKKSLLAIAIPALLAATAANAAEVYNKDGNKLDLYGQMKGRYIFQDGGKNRDDSYARLGFKGLTQINSDLAGYGQFEYEFKANKAEGLLATTSDKTRLAFAGLKFGQYGSVDYGRNYGVVYDVEGWTDVLPEWGGDSYTDTDNFMNQRATGVLTYRNTNLFGMVDGLKVAAQYQGKNENRDLKKQNGDGFGLSTTYAFGPGFTVGAAYSASQLTLDQQAAARGASTAEAWTVGGNYSNNGLYLAAMYAETRNMSCISCDVTTFVDQTKNFEVVAQYLFDFGLQPSLAYVYSKGTGIGANGNDADLVNYVSVGANYFFNKNMSASVDYKINQIKDSNTYVANNDDVVRMGLKYSF